MKFVNLLSPKIPILILIFYFNQISRLQQEIDLQGQIRDEMIIEYNNNNVTDENAKRKIQAKIANVDEKIQALGRFFILYDQMKTKSSFLFSCIDDFLLFQ
jgi:hypothetical protein